MNATDRNRFAYRTPYGPVTIAAKGADICRIALGDVALAGDVRPSATTNACSTQLLEYFAGKRTVFDLPLLIEGSAFQREVWEAVCAIPYGQAMTATEVAQLIGRPASLRAVGQAVAANPLAIIIPAHRVAPASGHVDAADHQAVLRAAFRTLEQGYSA